MSLQIFQIFKAGEHIAGSGSRISISESDLHHTAAAYRSTTAPLVLGHPDIVRQETVEKYGTVKRLLAKGGKLYAEAEVGRQLVDWVRAGRYKKVSASFFPPKHPNNPTPGIWTLRHVGFLGAYPPAVKGMEPLNFYEAAFYGDTVDFSEAGSGRSDNAIHLLALQYQNICGLPYEIAVHRAMNL